MYLYRIPVFVQSNRERHKYPSTLLADILRLTLIQIYDQLMIIGCKKRTFQTGEEKGEKSKEELKILA